MTVQDDLWVEKHRPKTLDEVIGHEQTIDRLKQYADDAETPHMIFSGPPGVGKTASIVAFAREVYGDTWRKNLSEMNASDERGIDTIRNKVKNIARSSPAGDADYQILLMDEFDQTTSDAQAALRRVMEQHSNVTRFFLSCNYPNQIIEAIQSRCTVFRFGRLSDGDIVRVTERVAEREGLDVESGAIETIVDGSGGDARKAIGNLQSANVNGTVTVQSAQEVSVSIDEEMIETIVQQAIGGEATEAMETLDSEFLKQGVNVNSLADSFLRVIKRTDMPAPGKAKVISKLAEVDWRVRQGANPNVQWHSFVRDIHVGYHLTLANYGDD